MHRSLVAFTLFAATSAVAVAADDPDRLPKTVVPAAYTIAVAPDTKTWTDHGRETIHVRANAPTDRILLNGADITVESASIDGTPVAKVTPDAKLERIALELAAPIAPGEHDITLAFHAPIPLGNDDGLYHVPYHSPDGVAHDAIATQFEAMGARHVFPCFDEPAFRATFDLTATIPANWTAIGNTPIADEHVDGANKIVHFARTPSMASYLLVLAAGDYLPMKSASAGVPQSIWALRGHENEAATPLAYGTQILPYYNAYFGVAYPLAKLDHIGVPQKQGAMENWGGITYGENALLLGNNPTQGQRERVFSIMAHEMAHQWFGDLVTMAWWDDTWLNESFASWMAAKATDTLQPTWQYTRDRIRARGAMNADARLSSHPIKLPVHNALDVWTAFDSEITYAKGEAMLRMFESYIGPDAFRSGLRSYMKAHAYGNTTANDLWSALGAASGAPIAQIGPTWTDRPGYPVVSVTTRCDARGKRTAALAQSRFLLVGTAPATSDWLVPMRIAAGDGAPRSYLLKSATASVPAGRCGTPFLANAGGLGFYRVAYDAQTARVNRSAFPRLAVEDRVALLDDTWNFARAGREPLGDALALAATLRTERDPAVWGTALAMFTDLERISRGSAVHDRFTASASALVTPIFTELGFDDRPADTPVQLRLRQRAIDALSSWLDPAVETAARAHLARFASLDFGARERTLRAVGPAADAATFDRLLALAKTYPDDRVRAVASDALFSVADPALAQRALDLIPTSDIFVRGAPARAGAIVNVAARHPDLAWAFLQVRGDELLKPVAPALRTQALTQLWRAFSRTSVETPAQAWVQARLDTTRGARSLTRAREDRAIDARLAPQIQPLGASSTVTDSMTSPTRI